MDEQKTEKKPKIWKWRVRPTLHGATSVAP